MCSRPIPLCFRRKTVRVPHFLPKVRMQLLLRATRDFNEDISKTAQQTSNRNVLQGLWFIFPKIHTCQAAQRCIYLRYISRLNYRNLVVSRVTLKGKVCSSQKENRHLHCLVLCCISRWDLAECCGGWPHTKRQAIQHGCLPQLARQWRQRNQNSTVQ